MQVRKAQDADRDNLHRLSYGSASPSPVLPDQRMRPEATPEGAVRRTRDRGEGGGMTPCACCGSTVVGTVTGLYTGVNGLEYAVSTKCPCGTNRAIKWEDTDESLRKIAIEQERLRLMLDGLI